MSRAEKAAAERPTLAAVARGAGVSASTASLAFSGAGPVSPATRERVLAVAEELGYGGPDPRARSLRRGRSGIVGAVIESSLSDAFRDPVNVAMLDGLADVTGPADNSLLLLTETTPAQSRLIDAPLDAVVLFGCSLRLDESVAVVRRRGMPVVSIEARPMDGVLDIGLDNVEASRTLARHLRELGHRRVAVVALELGPTRELGRITDERVAAGTTHTALQRLAGVREVFPGAGGVVTAGSWTSEGHRAGMLLLDVPPADRPTAIVAQSDLLASGVIAAAAELGLAVPAELSVVGFDGIRLDDPRAADLTTMRQPAVEKGRAAGRALLDLLAGVPAESQTFTSVFHPGCTTAPPREAGV